MSDLEDKGLIDKSQKGLLKNIIVSGDVNFQGALEKFDEGDLGDVLKVAKATSESFVDFYHVVHSFPNPVSGPNPGTAATAPDGLALLLCKPYRYPSPLPHPTSPLPCFHPFLCHLPFMVPVLPLSLSYHCLS